MKVVVDKIALEKAIEELLKESKRSVHSTRIDTIAGHVEEAEPDLDEPIEPSPLMATQLVTEVPPVSDPDFIPVTKNELSKSASAISQEVPDDQIEYFYRQLHELLDDVLDKHDELTSGEPEAIGLPKWMPVAESAFREKIVLILEQTADDISASDENPFSSDEEEEEYSERYFSNVGSDPVRDLSDAVFDFDNEIVGKWVGGGIASDARRNLESQYPYLFDKSISQIEKVASILDGPLSARLQAAVNQTGNRPETIKLLVGRHHEEAGYGKFEPDSEPYSSEQIQMNQGLAKELDELLPEKTYQEIIKFYEDRLSNMLDASGGSLSESDVVLAKGYEDMIAIVRGRIADDRKRERTDLSVKMAPRPAPESVEDVAEMSEEERLKKLDALAPFFGFKNASGIRQWRRKYAEPKFKAMLGSVSGIDAYKGYADKILDNMAALLDEFSTISEKTLSNLVTALEASPDDEELVDLRDAVSHMNNQFQEMLQRSLDDEDGHIPLDLLRDTSAGYMLRSAFADAYFNKQFRDFANDMKKHMVKFLTSLGLSSAVAGTFSKMFNGEVDLVPLNSEKRQAEKIRSGGVTQNIYDASVRESEAFTTDFFTGEYQKRSDQQFMNILQNKNKIKKLFEDSIDSAIGDLELESNIEREQMSPEQLLQLDQDSDTVTEATIRKMIYSMLG